MAQFGEGVGYDPQYFIISDETSEIVTALDEIRDELRAHDKLILETLKVFADTLKTQGQALLGILDAGPRGTVTTGPGAAVTTFPETSDWPDPHFSENN